jgi:hypothetical protein
MVLRAARDMAWDAGRMAMLARISLSRLACIVRALMRSDQCIILVHATD